MPYNSINTKNKKPLNTYNPLKTKKVIGMNKRGNACGFCGGSLIETKDTITIKGKTILQSVRKCGKCGESFVGINEYERVRRELHPSFLSRIKHLFAGDSSEVGSLLKGKVL